MHIKSLGMHIFSDNYVRITDAFILIRFLLPIVPLLLVYSGAFCSYLWSYRKAGRFSRLAKWLVILLFLLNGLMAGYFSMIHQRGTVDVMNHIAKDDQVSSVLFLMPCHSTPFYSYVHRPIEMKILDCQPKCVLIIAFFALSQV